MKCITLLCVLLNWAFQSPSTSLSIRWPEAQNPSLLMVGAGPEWTQTSKYFSRGTNGGEKKNYSSRYLRLSLLAFMQNFSINQTVEIPLQLDGASQEIQESQKRIEEIEEIQKHERSPNRAQSHWVWLVGQFLAKEHSNPRFYICFYRKPSSNCFIFWIWDGKKCKFVKSASRVFAFLGYFWLVELRF